MFQNSRLNELLKYFLSHKEYTSPSNLVKHFQISERTLRNDIREVNKEIKKNHVQILMKRGAGYYLDSKDPSFVSQLEESVNLKQDPLDSVDRRINHLIIKLLYANDYLNQDDLADEVFVSVNTIINYLKTIRAILNRYHLTLQNKANLGYLVVGEELDKRTCIVDLLTSNAQPYAFQFSNEQKALLNHVNLEKIKETVMDFNRKYDLHFTDYNLKNLILHIALSISRLQADKPIVSYPRPQNSQLDQLLHPLISYIEEIFQVIFTTAEKNYIFSHYVTSAGELLNQEHTTDYMHKLVMDILNCIYESYHIDLRTDRVLLNDLSQHLQAILNAKYYQLRNKNPLLHTIKNNYIFAYEVTETAVYQAFENEPFHLSEDDIGYIALHVGAAIERYFDSRYQHLKKVLIVYGNGYAEGSFLAAKITSLFKNVLEIAGRYPSHELDGKICNDIDLIISTVPLKQLHVSIPVLVVEIPLLRKNIENISRAITKERQHPVSKFSDLFDPSLFIRSSAKSRDEIIHVLCMLLKKSGNISDSFEKSVLERESKISTAMDGVLALPHPMTICSTKSQIAVAILEHPVKWSEKENAQIILMLSLADDKKKNIKALYDTFVAITNNPSLTNLLLRAESMLEFLQILEDNIPENAY